jgi:hypothetical protein
MCVLPKLGWCTLEPGKSVELRLVRAFLLGKPREGAPPTRAGEGLRVDTATGAGGRFDVIAVVTGALCKAAGEPPAPRWVGRVVTEPIELAISE